MCRKCVPVIVLKEPLERSVTPPRIERAKIEAPLRARHVRHGGNQSLMIDSLDVESRDAHVWLRPGEIIDVLQREATRGDDHVHEGRQVGLGREAGELVSADQALEAREAGRGPQDVLEDTEDDNHARREAMQRIPEGHKYAREQRGVYDQRTRARAGGRERGAGQDVIVDYECVYGVIHEERRRETVYYLVEDGQHGL